MPDITLVGANTLLNSPRATGVQAWPNNITALKLQLLDANWTQSGTTVVLDVKYSFDGGQTFPYQDLNEWSQGAKARDGSAPSVTIGPFTKDGVQQNPTHFDGTFRAGVGSPRCGLKAVV